MHSIVAWDMRGKKRVFETLSIFEEYADLLRVRNIIVLLMKFASSFGLITNRKNYCFHSANDRGGGAVYVLPTLLQSMLQYTPSVPNNFQIVQNVSKKFVSTRKEEEVSKKSQHEML